MNSIPHIIKNKTIAKIISMRAEPSPVPPSPALSLAHPLRRVYHFPPPWAPRAWAPLQSWSSLQHPPPPLMMWPSLAAAQSFSRPVPSLARSAASVTWSQSLAHPVPFLGRPAGSQCLAWPTASTLLLLLATMAVSAVMLASDSWFLVFAMALMPKW